MRMCLKSARDSEATASSRLSSLQEKPTSSAIARRTETCVETWLLSALGCRPGEGFKSFSCVTAQPIRHGMG